ncbi:hypothetical protein Taro_001338, partial [Colocasia esculenta]|nr:hypothetical protein [Colocasia esculenta]
NIDAFVELFSGNFYRIRSAFAFGAKRIAGLLECSKEELISEVNKFFMNTWRQHGAGHRPDAPSPNLWNIQNLDNTESEGSENFGNHAGQKMHGYEVDLSVSPQGITSHSVSSVNQHAHNRTGSLSANSAQTQMQKTYVSQYSSRVAECIERSISSSGHVSSDRGQRASRPDNLVNEYEGSGRSQFARTRSSPDLSDTPADVSSRRRNKMPETAKSQLSSARSEHTSRKKNWVSEMAGNRSGKSSSNDLSSIRHRSSNQDFDLTTDSICTSNSYHEDTDSVVLEMQQEEQDLINMMAASRVGNLNAQVQLPMNMPSAPLPFPSSSSVVASMGYLQRNLAGMLPENIPLMKPPWGSVIQFPHDLDSSQMPSYYPNAGLVSNPEEFVESGNESSSITEAEPDDVEHGFWQDQDNGSIRMSIAGDRNIQMLHSDDKTVSSTAALNSSSLRVDNSSGSFLRGQHKFVRDNRGFVKDSDDALRYHNNRGQDTYTTDRNMNSRFMATTPASSSRSKSSSESSWDGSSMKVSRLARDKHGRKVTSNAVPSPHAKSKNGWQYEDSSSDHVSVSAEDDNREWIPLSTIGTDVVERSTGSSSLGPVETHAHHSSGYEPMQTNSSDSVVPVTPVLVSAGSRPRTEDDHGVMPFAFYPTGPPVPFLAMLPVYPYDSGNSNGSTSQLDNGRLENGHINPSDHKLGSREDLQQPDAHINTSSMEFPSFEQPEGHKSDILNSDLASHWQNLQFGRFCQNTRYHGPLMYSSPVVIPPVYLQGHFPWDGPGRPLLANMNLLTQIMNYGPQLVPMAPLQPSQSRSSSAYRRYGDEVPRYRGGTGTYLPNPVSFRDRQYPSTRHHRGGYGYERRDHGDREGSWINSKSRAAGRSHGRNQAEKSSSRSEWLSVADNRPDKSWDSYRREPVASYQNQNSSFTSTNIQGSANMAYGMYQLPAVNSNGVNAVGPTVPSVMMLYSYDPGASYASSSEQLEFGSLGPVHLSHKGEVTQDMDGGPVRDSFDQRQGAYEQGSAHSSPDQPSSPHVH